MQRPQVALDLHYLLTFYGEEAQLEPQRLFGSVVRTLHARPVLTRQQIQQTLAVEPFNTLLAGSNLATGAELVKFSPIPLSLEESLQAVVGVFPDRLYPVCCLPGQCRHDRERRYTAGVVASANPSPLCDNRQPITSG